MKIVVDKSVLEQAQVALEKYNGALTHFNEVIDYAPAITALVAALAQQDEPVEPVAICCNCLGTKRPHADDPEWKGRCDCEPPQLAEPVQEPAFHGFMSDDGTQVDVCFSPSAPRKDGTYATAYYTAPPQRKN